MTLGDKIRDEIHAAVEQDILEQQRRRVRGIPAGTISGLVLIAIGTLFLLDHMNILHIGNLWKFWPIILIIVGISKVFAEGNRVGGAMMLLIGAYFQLNNLGLIHLAWETFWPVLLIIAGVLMIGKRFERHFQRGTANTPGGGGGVLNEFALFGGVERRVTVNNFREGRVEAIFGGVEVDLRSADIEGDEALIEVDALFGGIEITVPDRWIVIYQGQSIFGGYSDETRAPAPDVLGNAPRKTLVLRGRALFGGIVVKN